MTVDVDREMLGTGRIWPRHRHRKFISDAFSSAEQMTLFRHPHGEGLDAIELRRGNDGSLEIVLSAIREHLHPGDQIVFQLVGRGASRTFNVIDGSVAFILHVARRADSRFLARLSTELPTIDDLVVSRESARDRWVAVRNMVLAEIAASVIRGPLSALPLQRLLEAQEVGLAVAAGDSGQMMSVSVDTNRVFHHPSFASEILHSARILFDDPSIEKQIHMFEEMMGRVRRRNN